MRLGFGITALARGLRTHGIDGIASYTRELLVQLGARKDVQLVPVSFGLSVSTGEISPQAVRCLGKYPPAALLSAGSGLSFPGTRRLAADIDLMHATDHLIPRMRATPVVATVMDAIPLSHPEWVRSPLRQARNILWRKTVHWADRIITISHHSRGEIEEHFGIPAERIEVISLGVDERWFHPLPADLSSRIATELDLPERYFLFVGTLQPRKNVERLLDAHQALPASVRDNVPLIIVGRAGWQCQALVDRLREGAARPAVRWLRHVADDQLLTVMQRATALVFPSLHEGFGLPVLEAFAAGVPVITSDSTSLPEVAGDAALLVDPRDTTAIATAMERLVEDEMLAQSLRMLGRQRAEFFSWQRTATLTADLYQRVLSEKH